jgi:hypothetical protein
MRADAPRSFHPALAHHVLGVTLSGLLRAHALARWVAPAHSRHCLDVLEGDSTPRTGADNGC